ncbi:hypothetical protein [Lactococcus termiticola]
MIAFATLMILVIDKKDKK